VPLYRRDQGLKRAAARGGFVLRRVASGGPPVNTALPLIDGAAVADEPLVAVDGAYANGPVLSRAYQWRLNATDVAGATSRNWLPGTVNENASVTVRETVTTTGGSVSAESAPMVLGGTSYVDPFTAGADIALTSYVSPTGSGYARGNSATPNVTVSAATGRVSSDNAGTSTFAWLVNLPQRVTHGNYISSLTAHFTASILGGVLCRVQTGVATGTFYALRWNPATALWELIRNVAGAGTVLASSASAPINTSGGNDVRRLRITARGQGSPVTVTGQVFDSNGNLQLTLGPFDDTAANRITAAGRPGIWFLRSGVQYDDFTVTSGPLTNVAAASNAPYQIADNGNWTWFNNDNQAVHDGVVYTGFTMGNGADAGKIGIVRNDRGHTSATTAFTTGIAINDHANPSLLVLPDNRLMVAWSAHNGSAFYRISTNPLPDIANWGPIVTFSSGTGANANSYTRLFNFENGWLGVLSRKGQGANPPNPTWLFRADLAQVMANRNDAAASAALWTGPTQQFTDTSGRPYPIMVRDTDGTIYVHSSTDHPNEGAARLVLLKGVPQAGGSLSWFNGVTDTAITDALPFNLTSQSGSLVMDNSAGVNWTWDIKLFTENGQKVCYLASTKYPSSTTGLSRTAIVTDIEYWLHRVVIGSGVVTSWRFATGQVSIYATESCYAAGLQIDAVDPSVIYSAERDSGTGFDTIYRVPFNWATGARGAAVAIKPGAGVHQRRPNALRVGGQQAVSWWEGAYTTWTDFSTVVCTVPRA
jgi:hypothetical protein